MLTSYRFFKNIHLNKYKNSISEKEIVLLYVVLIQNNTQQYSTLMKKVLYHPNQTQRLAHSTLHWPRHNALEQGSRKLYKRIPLQHRDLENNQRVPMWMRVNKEEKRGWQTYRLLLFSLVYCDPSKKVDHFILKLFLETISARHQI